MNPNPDNIPANWDSLRDRAAADEEESAPPKGSDGEAPGLPVIALVAASWADLVGMLAVCTGALVALLALGERPALSAFPWAAALALAWWGFAASVLVVVRQGTPGMLLAGLSFEQPVRTGRVPWVLAAALFGVATLGLVGLVGARSSPLRLAAASDLTTVSEE